MDTAIKISLALVTGLLSFAALAFLLLGLLLRVLGVSFQNISYSSFGIAIGASIAAVAGIWQLIKRYHRLEDG